MTQLTITRRALLRAAIPTAIGMARFGTVGPVSAAESDAFPPVRRITRGPRHHWFGYYDKLQFDPSCRYVLGMEVDFEHRSPTARDTINIGMVDLADNDR